MRITWSAQARRDLQAIRDFIAHDSEHYARLQIERLISRVERAAGMPSRINYQAYMEYADEMMRT
jgi:plasmid stabilization system protein ParE